MQNSWTKFFSFGDEIDFFKYSIKMKDKVKHFLF